MEQAQGEWVLVVWERIWDAAEGHILEMLRFLFPTLLMWQTTPPWGKKKKNTEINVSAQKNDLEELESEHKFFRTFGILKYLKWFDFLYIAQE